MERCCAFALVLLGACASTGVRHPASQNADDAQPSMARLNPAWLELLSTNLADTRPVVAAVDLDGAADSEMFSGVVEERADSTWYREGDTYFVSWYMGSTRERVHVFRLSSCYGGSGVFGSLLFVRLEVGAFVAGGARRRTHVLRAVGEHTLGDRYRGCTVMLVEDVVRIVWDGETEEVSLRGLGIRTPS